jgi:membrane fusion protein (multidrug efflux system)
MTGATRLRLAQQTRGKADDNSSYLGILVVRLSRLVVTLGSCIFPFALYSFLKTCKLARLFRAHHEHEWESSMKTRFMQFRFANAAIILMAMIALILSGCAGKEKSATASAPPPGVVVMEVTPRDVQMFGEWVGQTAAESSVELIPQVDGLVESTPFDEGGTVGKDQVIARIDPRQYDAALLIAKAQVTKAEADLKLANLDVSRTKPLRDSGAVPQQDLDNALGRQLTSQAALEAAKANVVQADLNLTYTVIRAPFDGRADRKLVRVGDLARARTSVITTVSKVDPIVANFAISELDYLAFQERAGPSSNTGQTSQSVEVEMILADGKVYPGKGRLSIIDPKLNPETGTIGIQASFPNPDFLIRPAQFVRLRMQTEEKKNVILIPENAIVRVLGAEAVYVVGEDNVIEQRTVRTGKTVGDERLIENGLEPGERIVVEGVQKARPGRRVKPQVASATAGADRPTSASVTEPESE